MKRRKQKMLLSTEDTKLFYQLWLPIISYVNERYNMKCGNNEDSPLSWDVHDFKKVADKLWENIAILDEYLNENTNIPEDHRNIMLGWKRFKKGNFVLVNHLKSGSILNFIEDNTTYRVLGIQSSLKEMFYWYKLPVVIRGTLIPFRDVIISDGLFALLNISMGRNIAGSYWDKYMEDKKTGKIVKTL
jgi:hypothetical protein